MHYTETEINVRYAETDKMDVVYHSNYLIWFEVARTEFIEQVGFSYADMEKAGVISPVVDVKLSYKRSITYPEKIIVKTWIKQYSPIRTVYEYEVIKENRQLAATGETTHVILNRETMRPIRLDRHFKEWHEKYMELYESN